MENKDIKDLIKEITKDIPQEAIVKDKELTLLGKLLVITIAVSFLNALSKK